MQRHQPVAHTPGWYHDAASRDIQLRLLHTTTIVALAIFTSTGSVFATITGGFHTTLAICASAGSVFATAATITAVFATTGNLFRQQGASRFVSVTQAFGFQVTRITANVFDARTRRCLLFCHFGASRFVAITQTFDLHATFVDA